jgi:hypothetical protein
MPAPVCLFSTEGPLAEVAAQRGSPAARAGGVRSPEQNSALVPIYTIGVVIRFEFLILVSIHDYPSAEAAIINITSHEA